MEYRAAWGARPPRYRNMLSRSDGCSLHYPGAVLSSAVERADYDAVAAYLRGIQNFHMDTNYLTRGGGSDIAYSFFVDSLGRQWEGRGWGISGGHTMGANSSCHGIQLIISTGARPTEAQIAGVRGLIGEHDRRYGRGWVKGHMEVAGNPSGTSCPGGPILDLIHSGAFDPHQLPPPPPEEEDMPLELVQAYGAHVVYSPSSNIATILDDMDTVNFYRFIAATDPKRVVDKLGAGDCTKALRGAVKLLTDGQPYGVR